MVAEYYMCSGKKKNSYNQCEAKTVVCKLIKEIINCNIMWNKSISQLQRAHQWCITGICDIWCQK